MKLTPNRTPSNQNDRYHPKLAFPLVYLILFGNYSSPIGQLFDLPAEVPDLIGHLVLLILPPKSLPSSHVPPKGSTLL